MAEPAATRAIAGIEPLLDRYDGFLVDQFGVLHDGVRPLPGAREALEALKVAGRTVIILSNSGRRNAPNEARLTRIGLPHALYTAFVGAGEVTWQGLRAGDDPTFAGLGRRCLLFTRGGDHSVVDDLPLELVDAASADFVLLAGIDHDDTSHRHCAAQLAQALARGLPMLCSNPDLFSIEGDHWVEGPGTLAARYAAGGGEVRYVGKPWPAIYRMALAMLQLPPDRIVAVGDSLAHDVAGAAPFGIDSALVAGGVHAAAFAGAVAPQPLLERLDSLAPPGQPRPRWLLPAFRPASSRGAS
jgi:HAD superfamily hydrolase (TIGR01459 family)